jgi:predicted glycosyltransferase
MNPIQTPREALTLALFLAITAPTEEQCERACELANELARWMHPDDIRAAKINAKQRAARVLQ